MYIAKLIEQEFMHKKQSTRTRLARYNEEKKKLKTSTPVASSDVPVAADAAPQHSAPTAPSGAILESSLPINAKGHKSFKGQYRNRSAEDLVQEDRGYRD